ncbi:hypothetical protein ADUPG1_004011, partial [Aduncisulcus paluster]
MDRQNAKETSDIHHVSVPSDAKHNVVLQSSEPVGMMDMDDSTILEDVAESEEQVNLIETVMTSHPDQELKEKYATSDEHINSSESEQHHRDPKVSMKQHGKIVVQRSHRV